MPPIPDPAGAWTLESDGHVEEVGCTARHCTWSIDGPMTAEEAAALHAEHVTEGHQ